MKLLQKKKPVIQEEKYYSVIYWYTTPLRKEVNRVKNGSTRSTGDSAYDVAVKRIKQQFQTAGLSDEKFEILHVEDVSDICVNLSEVRTLEKTYIHAEMKDMDMWFDSENELSEWYVGEKSVDDVVKVGLRIINQRRHLKGVEKEYKALTPRDDFFIKALEDNDTKFLKYGSSALTTGLRIFQHWPAATGKGSFPRLAYDWTFEKGWNYSNGFPINVVVNPRLSVLKGNLQKVAEHDLAIKSGAVHVVFASDVTKGSRDAHELEVLRATSKVITDRVDFIRFIKENSDKTIWVHTTIHSYSRAKPGAAPGMVELLKSIEKTIYFSHIDEVHHTVLPEGAPWTAPLDNDIMPVSIRFMTSANKRIARKSTGGASKWSMENADWCDYKILSLTEKMAVDLGYKRHSQIWYTVYDKDSFPTNLVRIVNDKKNPYVKVDGFEPVPLHWFMSADCLVRFRINNLQYHHTKLTLNLIEHCKGFTDFLNHIWKPLLAHHKVDQATFSRMSKIHFKVADTSAKDTPRLLKEIAKIPGKYNDSILVHCQLLGEGWDPENGWVDSTMFVDPQGSPLKIYQDLNRGTRIGDGSIKIHPILMCGFQPERITNKCNYSSMFKVIYKVGKVLEIGEDDIKDKIIIKTYRKVPRPGGTKVRGTDTVDTVFDVGSDWLMGKLSEYFEGSGKYNPYAGLADEVVNDWIKAYDKYGLWLDLYGPDKFVRDSIIIKHWNLFEQFADPKSKFKDIVTGNDFRVSEDACVKIDNFNEKKVNEQNTRYAFLKKYADELDTNADKVFKRYVKKFGKFNTFNPKPLYGYESKLKYNKQYKYDKDTTFTFLTSFRNGLAYDAVINYKEKSYTNVSNIAETIDNKKKDTWIRRLLKKVA